MEKLEKNKYPQHNPHMKSTNYVLPVLCMSVAMISTVIFLQERQERRKNKEIAYAEFFNKFQDEKTLMMPRLSLSGGYENSAAIATLEFSSGAREEIDLFLIEIPKKERFDVGDIWTFHFGNSQGSWIVLDKLIEKSQSKQDFEKESKPQH